MYFSNCFTESSPTKAVTGIAASFLKRKKKITMLCSVILYIPKIKKEYLLFYHPFDKLVVIRFFVSHM